MHFALGTFPLFSLLYNFVLTCIMNMLDLFRTIIVHLFTKTLLSRAFLWGVLCKKTERTWHDLHPSASWALSPSALWTCTCVTSFGYPQHPVQHVWSGSSSVSSLENTQSSSMHSLFIMKKKIMSNILRITCRRKVHPWRCATGSLPAGWVQRSWEWWHSGPPSGPCAGRRCGS